MLSVPCGGEEGACTRLPNPGDNSSSSSEEREASELEDCTASWGQRAAHMNQSVLVLRRHASKRTASNKPQRGIQQAPARKPCNAGRVIQHVI